MLNKYFQEFVEKVKNICFENNIKLVQTNSDDGYRFDFEEIIINGQSAIYFIDKEIAESQDPSDEEAISIIQNGYSSISSLIKEWKKKDE